MKRILCAILAVLMLCSVGVAMVSCGVSMESMKKNCEKLKEKGEIVDYSYDDDDDDMKIISAYTTDGKYFTAVECKSTDEAKTQYDEAEKMLDEMGDEAKDYILKRNGKIVIMATDKDLYKKIA